MTDKRHDDTEIEFVDALANIGQDVKRIIREVAGKPLFDFGPEFDVLTQALAMITEPSPLLGLVVGGPKVGKTNLLINLALGLVEHTPRAVVAFVSAEVPRNPLRSRILCAELARERMRGKPVTLSSTLGDLAPQGREMRTMAAESLEEVGDALERHPRRMLMMDREALPGGVINPRAVHAALTKLRHRVGPSRAIVLLLDYDAYIEVTTVGEGVVRDEQRIQILRALAQRHTALVITPHQARKGSPGAGWNGEGFEATKGSGEFVYAADFVLRLTARALDDESEPGLSLMRGDLMNRHGAGGEWYLEARHERAHIRVAGDQQEAKERWDAARSRHRRRRTPDPGAVKRVLAKVDLSVSEAGGSHAGAVRLLGLEATEAHRMAIRRIHHLRRVPERFIDLLDDGPECPGAAHEQNTLL